MTRLKKVASLALIASGLALGACAYDGYGGVGVGYGSAGYYDDYAYGPYGYAPYGWYGGYYYPGNGYWLYDRGGGRHRWNDEHRRYWEHRREQAGNNWHGPNIQPWRRGLRDDERQAHRDWRQNRSPTVTQQQVREHAVDASREAGQSRVFSREDRVRSGGGEGWRGGRGRSRRGQ